MNLLNTHRWISKACIKYGVCEINKSFRYNFVINLSSKNIKPAEQKLLDEAREQKEHDDHVAWTLAHDQAMADHLQSQQDRIDKEIADQLVFAAALLETLKAAEEELARNMTAHLEAERQRQLDDVQRHVEETSTHIEADQAHLAEQEARRELEAFLANSTVTETD